MNEYKIPVVDLLKLVEQEAETINKYKSVIEQYFKICERCGKRFCVFGKRKDSKFCDNIMDGETKTCKELGAYEKYKSKINNSPVLSVYKTAYTTHHGRYRTGKWTNEQFLEWVTLAKEMVDKVNARQITFEEFFIWSKK